MQVFKCNTLGHLDVTNDLDIDSPFKVWLWEHPRQRQGSQHLSREIIYEMLKVNILDIASFDSYNS